MSAQKGGKENAPQGMQWTYLGSGMKHPNFLARIEQISPEKKKQIEAMAPMFC